MPKMCEMTAYVGFQAVSHAGLVLIFAGEAIRKTAMVCSPSKPHMYLQLSLKNPRLHKHTGLWCC